MPANVKTGTKSRVLVLGGGVAGLAASIAANAPLFEANSKVGGVAKTKRVDGFSFDYGIHILQTKNSQIQELLRRHGIALCTRRRNAKIYSHGTFTAYPFQVNTAGLPVKLRARCVWNYIRRPRTAALANYQDWIYQAVGRGFGDTFLIPYSEKFWTVHPREMTFEWTGNRVPQTGLWDVLRGSLIDRQSKHGTNAVFEYPEGHGGYGTIPSKFGEAVTDLNLNHRATLIDADNRIVEFNGGKVAKQYDNLISTIPLPSLIETIQDVPDDVRDAAKRLRHNSIYVVNLGVEGPPLGDHHWIHFPEPDISFFRMSLPHNLSPGMVPQGKYSISAEVSYSDCRPIDKESIVDAVIDDLRRVGILGDENRVVLRDVIDIKYGYVVYDQNRKESVDTLHEWLASKCIYPTGRYGLWAYLWSHEAILAGMQAGKRLS